jgi:DNA-binding CsgD family transcriptional regulator
MNEAKEAGLLGGIAIPICSYNGELAAIAMARSVGKIRPAKNIMSRLHLLSLQFHLAYTELHIGECPPLDAYADVHLTDREKEVLLWTAEGKSDPIIADILGISYSAVRFHMNKIFKKLNTNERTQAVVKAIRKGLIVPSRIT